MEKKQQIVMMLCVIYGIWHLATQWTSTLISFLQWDTKTVMTIVQLGYIQSFGSFCNAIGAFFFGQLIDSTGPKTIFIVSTVLTSLYYMGLSFARDFYSFFFLQLLRFGYHFDAAAEMYLATATTERERTQALMTLNVPQAVALFFGPLIAAKIAISTTLRTSQMLSGVFVLFTVAPMVWWLLPNTHSVPRLASARLRPQEYWPMVTRNSALREALLLRALIVGPYVAFELISRQFLMRAYAQGPYDTAL
uniref:Major facilitator superfamily (MFS) profile domain-containing protein n=1 Tax=Plectus sambesii TaxID=2011161 RepID=A0A914UMH8_9BILA